MEKNYSDNKLPKQIVRPKSINDRRILSNNNSLQITTDCTIKADSSNLETDKVSIVDKPLVTSFEANQPLPKQIVRPLDHRFIQTKSTEVPVSSKKGYALILNHYEYENGEPDTRKGTQFDVDKLKNVFDYYNVEHHVGQDWTLSRIKEEINTLKSTDFSKYACFVIVILTHGHRNEILWASDAPYNFIDVIEDPILIENKTLLNKPKIFVVQACRGGVEMPVLETDSVCVPSSRVSSVAKKNIFKCNATYEGYVSFRDTKRGTLFIQSFCEKLQTLGRTQSINNIMMKVIDEVSSDPEIPQVPTVVSSMTNEFCFGNLLE